MANTYGFFCPACGAVLRLALSHPSARPTSDPVLPTPGSAGRRHGLPLLITIREVTEMLGVSYWTVWRMVNKGELESVHVGRALRIIPSSVLSYLERKQETN